MKLLKSHIKVSYRNIFRHKVNSVFNLVGLSIALGFVFLTFLFIQNELSFDKFHFKKNNIYRVYHKKTDSATGSIKDQSAVTAVPLSKDLAAAIPLVTAYTRLGSSSATVRVDHQPYEETISFVDSAFFNIFNFPILRGNRTKLFSNLNSVVISEEIASKYFGLNNPIGATIQIDINGSLLETVITGVFDAKKSKSSIQLDLVIPFANYLHASSPDMMASYRYGLVENYIFISASKEQKDLESLLTDAIQKYIPESKTKLILGLQRLSGMHQEDHVLGNATFISPKHLYIMLAIGMLVLIVTTVNFVTLSASQSISRIREMGVRRTLGAFVNQLRFQLIIEALMVVLIATLFGLLLSFLTHPLFSSLIGRSFVFNIGLNELVFLSSIGVLIAILTGLIQSIILVKYNTTDALKGIVLPGKGNSSFNNVLIVFQFSIALILIIGAVHVKAQMNYINHRDLGFQKEQLIEISMGSPSSIDKSKLLLERFKSEAIHNENIIFLSASMNSSREPWTELGFTRQDGQKENIYYNQVDAAYFKTMEIDITAGESFRTEGSQNVTSIIVNEALVKRFFLEGDALSKQIPLKNLSNNHKIIGVCADYHFGSLHNKIEPLIIALDASTISDGITGLSTYVWPPNLYQLLVRVRPGDTKRIISELENIWLKVNPDKEFVYHFVDEEVAAQYEEEAQWGRVINIASLFTILIVWLGLFALLKLSLDKRKTEFGIRQVLGSSPFEIIMLISKKYFWLVSTGILISVPVSWTLISQWLSTFAYHIDLNPLLFLFSCTVVFLFTLLTVGSQSFIASLMNPVHAIKGE